MIKYASFVVSVLLFCIIISFGARLPPNYKRCDRKAADVDQCLVQAFQGILSGFPEPIPKIGLPIMDPLFIPQLKIAAGPGSVSVRQEYKNLKITGLKDSKVSKLKFDFDKKLMEYELLIPVLRMLAEYEVSGKVIILPVEGNGHSTIVLDNCNVHMMSPFEVTEKKGKRFLSFKNSKLILAPSHGSVNFENLFNGNKELGDNINKMLNENWRGFFLEVGPAFEEVYGTILEGITNSVFGKVPVSEIFPD